LNNVGFFVHAIKRKLFFLTITIFKSTKNERDKLCNGRISFAIKKKKTRKSLERDQKTTYSLTPIAVKFLMYTKELRNIGGRKSQRVIIPHILIRNLLSPSTVNTLHGKKEQSHEFHLAFIDIHGQNARFLKISVAPPNLQNVYKIFAVIRK
jgi:hypothetical protein